MNEQKTSAKAEKSGAGAPLDNRPESEIETPEVKTRESVQNPQNPSQKEHPDEITKYGDGTDGEKDGQDAADGDAVIEDLQRKIATMSEALELARDKSLRAQAEVENIRRRTAIEQANSRKFAIEGFASELLSVKDSLDLAEKVELSADNDAVISKMQEGLTLTLKQLEQVFEKFSIKIISPEKGDKLNPEIHQAMTIVPSDDVAPNCVLDVIQKGYQLHDRLLRPAMVVIAKQAEQKSNESKQ